MKLILDKKTNTATVKLEIPKIKFNKERRIYYYDNNAIEFLHEQGLKPVRCLKSCVVDNVRNNVGEWIFELEAKKKKPETIKVVEPIVIEEEKPAPPVRIRRRVRKLKTE